MSDGRTHWEGCYKEYGHKDCAVAQIKRLTGDLLDAREEYKQRQEWAAKQSMEVISRLQARVEALEAVKEAAQEALECLYFHSFEPGEDPRISNLAGAMLVADGTLAATEQEGK